LAVANNEYLRPVVVEAARDYKYLLNRGYSQRVVLDLVTSHYGLTRTERALLLRCIHRDDEVASIRRKVSRDIYGEVLVIDGYNTILTIVSALEGPTLYLCDDCIVRDLRSSYIKDFSTPLVTTALRVIGGVVSRLGARKVVFVLDRNVSWSGIHANIIRNILPNVEVRLARRADIEIISSGAIVASSDYVILSRVKKVYDMAGYIVLKHVRGKIIRVDRYICKEPCKVE